VAKHVECKETLSRNSLETKYPRRVAFVADHCGCEQETSGLILFCAVCFHLAPVFQKKKKEEDGSFSECKEQKPLLSIKTAHEMKTSEYKHFGELCYTFNIRPSSFFILFYGFGLLTRSIVRLLLRSCISFDILSDSLHRGSARLEVNIRRNW
jgi:hypothetical protein